MKIAICVLLLFVFAAPLQAADILAQAPGIAPQVVDGNDWNTTITVVNLDTITGSFSLYFFSDAGQPLPLHTSMGNGFAFINRDVPPGGSVTISTLGDAPAGTQGWAFIENRIGTIGGTVVLSRLVPGLQPIEASYPLVTAPSTRYMIPFDHSAGASGLALVNREPFVTPTIRITLRDEDGALLGSRDVVLQPWNHIAFMLVDMFPASNGKKGVMELTGLDSKFFFVMALRATAAGSVTAVEAMVNSAWR